MSFYGDIFRWWYGTVVETGTDQQELDRVKVRVDGIHGPNIADADCPYAQCVLPATGGGTSGIGENPRLEQGAKVFGFFADGMSSQSPIVIGSVPHIGFPSRVQVSNQNTSSEAILTTARTGTKDLFTGFIPDKTPTGENVDNPHLAWDFFSTASGLNYQYKQHHIAAMIGNFMIEGRNFIKDETTGKTRKVEMDPTAVGDKGVAIGIVQWGPDRQKDLKEYAAKIRKPVTDLLTQLSFVDWELKNKSFLRGEFFQTTNVLEATMMFMRQYERPQILKKTTSMFVNRGTFGWPRHYWNQRISEEERVKEARKAFNLFTQHHPE